MKIIWGKNYLPKNSVRHSFYSMSTNEMLCVKGGTDKIKPRPRPNDFFDDEEGKEGVATDILNLDIKIKDKVKDPKDKVKIGG